MGVNGEVVAAARLVVVGQACGCGCWLVITAFHIHTATSDVPTGVPNRSPNNLTTTHQLIVPASTVTHSNTLPDHTLRILVNYYHSW